MTSLTPLASLSTIQQAVNSASEAANQTRDLFGNTTTGTAGSPSVINQIGQVGLDAVGSVTNFANKSTHTLFGFDVEDIIFIILGLLLIAAGIFAFKSTQTIVETGTRLATRASEVAAV